MLLVDELSRLKPGELGRVILEEEVEVAAEASASRFDIALLLLFRRPGELGRAFDEEVDDADAVVFARAAMSSEGELGLAADAVELRKGDCCTDLRRVDTIAEASLIFESTDSDSPVAPLLPR